ncbi:MAG TPA: dipeptidase [Beutenbergiaceae bacterium]|nr:dipeptidase [Beutenbergiaceae bacterium]
MSAVSELIPIIDGHNDLPWKCRKNRGSSVAGLDQESANPQLQTDMLRLLRGGVAGQFWSVWVHTEITGAQAVQATLEQIDVVHRMVTTYPQTLAMARSATDVEACMSAGRIASLLGVEGGHQINDSLAVLRQYARLGVRYMTLTWNDNTSWADSATDDPVHGGLSDRGREVVAEMNRTGMMVDLSHVAPSTMRDALDATRLPVLFTHSSSAGVNAHPRNVPDDVLARLAANDGVQMLTFVPAFLSAEYWAWAKAGKEGQAPPVTVAEVADHVEHAREVAGIDHIGLGGDYDGAGPMPTGLEDVAGYPNLMAELAVRGWSNADLHKLGHQNVLRVLRANDQAHQEFMASDQ